MLWTPSALYREEPFEQERDLEDARTVMRSLHAQLDMNLIETSLKTLSTEVSDYDFMTRWLSVKAVLSES